MGKATPQRRGSTSSDRQIAYAVRDERYVEFRPFQDYRVSGFVMGSDDYHWVVVTTRRETLLVHKSCPLVTVTTYTLDSMLGPHAQRQAGADREKWSADLQFIRDLTKPFRDSVMTNHFRQTPTEESAA